MILLNLNSSEGRTTSPPLASSPSREIRGIRLFRAISRRLVGRSTDDLATDAESRSSSSDSCSDAGKKHNSPADSGFRSVSPHPLSSSSSEAGSDVGRRLHHQHSTSAETLLKAFQSLNLNIRSKSCTNTKETKRKNGKKVTPKKILRSPVSYTYVRGLSGLPTKRVPKNTRTMLNTSCNCSLQHMTGLNR